LIGWRDSEEGHLTPESGLSYWLGIGGASAMLLLLLYPLRKRMKALRGFGRLSAWFRIHMLLGVVGPALILFRCNFKLGSLNSNVALFSMRRRLRLMRKLLRQYLAAVDRAATFAFYEHLFALWHVAAIAGNAIKRPVGAKRLTSIMT